MLKKSIESIFSDIVICELNEIKKASKYLYKYNSILLKLSNFGFKKLGFLLQSDKIINESLLKYKSKKFKALKKKFGKLRYNNIILFCAGKTSIMATKILTNMGAKITIIIDNNNKFYGKKLDNIINKNPSYLEKNLGKFSNHKILICIKNIDPANIIKLQLNKIGIKNNNNNILNNSASKKGAAPNLNNGLSHPINTPSQNNPKIYIKLTEKINLKKLFIIPEKF